MAEVKKLLEQAQSFRVTLEPWEGKGSKYVLKASFQVADDEKSFDLHVELVEGE